MGSFFPSLCTIYARVTAENVIGEKIETPADDLLDLNQEPIAGLERIACNFSDDRSWIMEKRTQESTFITNLKYVILIGFFPEITEDMRAVIDGKAYDIRGVLNCSVGTHTELAVEEIRR